MTNKLLPAFGILLTLWLSLTNSIREPNNPPVGKTGAPGEQTCGQSGCHSGGTYTGTVSISGIPDTVTASEIYTLTLTQTSNAVRAGFELTCLDGSNTMCGTLTAGAGSSIGTSTNGRKYARQSSPKNLSNGSVSWTFIWKAPASAANNSATFYFVSLAANGNGQNSGDKVLAATKAVVLKTSTPAHEPSGAEQVKLYPTLVQGVLNIDLLEAASGQLAVLDMSGKTMLQMPLVATNKLDVSHLPRGTYLAHLTIGGKSSIRKFIVE